MDLPCIAPSVKHFIANVKVSKSSLYRQLQAVSLS